MDAGPIFRYDLADSESRGSRSSQSVADALTRRALCRGRRAATDDRSGRPRSSSASSPTAQPASDQLPDSARASPTSSAKTASAAPSRAAPNGARRARLLRPALRLPARRRGEPGAGGVRRPGRLPGRSAAYRPWEALEPFIDDAMIRQLDSFAPAGEPGRRRRRHAARDGLHDRHRRLRRQPAAQRDRVGADPARGRHPRPQQRHRPDRLHAPALRVGGVPGRRRPPSTPASRTTTTTPRAPRPTSTTRRPARRATPACPSTRG